jgi:hypothetical protein
MICCFFSSFKTFAILREATYPPAAVNVLDVSSESMAAFQVFMYGRFWVFTEEENGNEKVEHNNSAESHCYDSDCLHSKENTLQCLSVMVEISRFHVLTAGRCGDVGNR